MFPPSSPANKLANHHQNLCMIRLKEREVELEPYYNDCDFARNVLQLIPYADERAKIKVLLGQFKEFEEVSKILQEDKSR